MTLLTGIALAVTVSCGALIGLTFGAAPPEVLLVPGFYVGLWIACGLLFIASITVHPDARSESDGLHTRVGVGFEEVVRSAPVWTMVLVGMSIVTLLWCVYEGRHGESHFAIDRASLVGRPDRWRSLVAFGMVFSAFACIIAGSGERRQNAWMNVP